MIPLTYINNVITITLKYNSHMHFKECEKKISLVYLLIYLLFLLFFLYSAVSIFPLTFPFSVKNFF